MFNEEIKKRYIEEKEKAVILPNNYLVLQFSKVGEIENELQKDVCNFTSYEIIDYYKVLNLSSLESLFVLNSQLSMYTQWCLQENLVKDNQNHFLEFTKEILSDCVNKVVFDKKIVSRETVLGWVDELPNPKDQFIMLALFEFGKSKNFTDIVSAKTSDIDGHKMVLNDGREVFISDKLLSISEDSLHESVYYSVSGKGLKTMPLKDNGNTIVKNYPNVKDEVSEFQKGRVIYNSITRSLDYVGVLDWCSANSLAESGKLEMIKRRASELEITPMEYIYSSRIEEVEQQYGCKIVRSVYVTKYKEYLG